MKILKKIRNTKSNYTNLLAMDFGTISDFMDEYNAEEQVEYNAWGEYRFCDPSSNQERDRRFHGDAEFGTSLDSAKRLLTRGYQPKQMRGAFADFDTAFESTQDIIRMTEEGYDFDIPSLLSGDDEVWFTRVNKGSAPSIHIVYEGGANADVKAMNFYIQSAVVNKLAEILGEEAHVRVSATYSAQNQARCKSTSKDIHNVTYVEMKSYDEPLDLRRLGACSHPSFFRRVMFGVFENPKGMFFGDDAKCSRGYGRQSDRYNLGMTEDMENELFESDIVVKIPSPSMSHFENVDNAIKFCLQKLEEVNAIRVA